MRRSAFGRLHPAASYAVGGGILLYAFLTRDPFSALLLTAGVLAFDAEVFGMSFAAKRFSLFLLITLAGGVTNPLISHRGVTILFYIGNGAITAESAAYGAVSCALLADVILWCEALYRALPPDAALYYPAKILPRTTLVFTMAIRFVPRLMTRLRETRTAQRAFHPDNTPRNALSALQTGVALTLEECCEIAAGMEERGYGKNKRQAYALYRFRRRDAVTVFAALFITACLAAGYALGAFRFNFYPMLAWHSHTLWYVFPMLLVFFPAMTERKEKWLWRSSKSKT